MRFSSIHASSAAQARTQTPETAQSGASSRNPRGSFFPRFAVVVLATTTVALFAAGCTPTRISAKPVKPTQSLVAKAAADSARLAKQKKAASQKTAADSTERALIKLMGIGAYNRIYHPEIAVASPKNTASMATILFFNGRNNDSITVNRDLSKAVRNLIPAGQLAEFRSLIGRLFDKKLAADATNGDKFLRAVMQRFKYNGLFGLDKNRHYWYYATGNIDWVYNNLSADDRKTICEIGKKLSNKAVREIIGCVSDSKIPGSALFDSRNPQVVGDERVYASFIVFMCFCGF